MGVRNVVCCQPGTYLTEQPLCNSCEVVRQTTKKKKNEKHF